MPKSHPSHTSTLNRMTISPATFMERTVRILMKNLSRMITQRRSIKKVKNHMFMENLVLMDIQSQKKVKFTIIIAKKNILMTIQRATIILKVMVRRNTIILIKNMFMENHARINIKKRGILMITHTSKLYIIMKKKKSIQSINTQTIALTAIHINTGKSTTTSTQPWASKKLNMSIMIIMNMKKVLFAAVLEVTAIVTKKTRQKMKTFTECSSTSSQMRLARSV